METQLVRLDAPYNIICSTDGRFALHIATLIIVKENNKNQYGETLSVSSYPVVNEKTGISGQVWKHSKLDDCYVVCPEGCQSVLINELKRLMNYCAKHNVYQYTKRIPMSYNLARHIYGFNINLPKDANNNPIKDYEVCLEFEEDNNGNTCMAYADDYSFFYFYEYFANDPNFFGQLNTNIEAINSMIELRNDYIRIYRLDSITFKTDNKKYQWFVDSLNETKADGEKL